MTTTDCFGREVTADWTPPAIAHVKRIGYAHSYVGRLTHYRGIGWTHSLQRHGTEPFASPDLAEQDFWHTKVNLPVSVHRVLFGRAA